MRLSRIFILILLFPANCIHATEIMAINLTKPVTTHNKIVEAAPKYLAGLKNHIRYDIFHDGNDTNSRIRNMMQDAKLKKYKIESGEGKIVYLQSVTSLGGGGWSVVLNNISIDSGSASKNLSNLVEIYSVNEKTVELKIVNPSVDILRNATNKARFRIVKYRDKIHCFVRLMVNEFIDLDTYDIQSGNMMNNLYHVEKIS